MTQVILLTAAIRPANVPKTTLLDPHVRRAQYDHALEAWARVASAAKMPIVVVETTGNTLLAPKGFAKSAFTCLSFEPPNEFIEFGKGALEWAALDFAAREIHAQFGPEATVHKATGRLKLSNPAILQEVGYGALRARRTLDRTYCDSRLFSVCASTWVEFFEGNAGQIRDAEGRYFEHVLARQVSQFEWTGQMHIERFSAKPRLRGVSGSTGANYGDSLFTSAKDAFSDLIEPRMLGRLSRKLF